MRHLVRTRAAAALAAGAIAVSLLGFGGCTTGSDSSSGEPRSQSVEEPEGDACPRSPRSRPNPDVGVALGRGPVYPVLGFEKGKQVVELSADELRDGSYWHKTLWAVDPAYDGPVLIRGHGIDPPQEMGFGYDDRELRELELPAQETDRWRYGPSVTILPGPGCYAFEVEGNGFKEMIVFEAR